MSAGLRVASSHLPPLRYLSSHLPMHYTTHANLSICTSPARNSS